MPARLATVQPLESGSTDVLLRRWGSPDSPGAAIGVAQEGKVLGREGYGLASIGHGIPVGPHAAFRLASMTVPARNAESAKTGEFNTGPAAIGAGTAGPLLTE
jgi:hypothetical protein